MLLNDKTYVKDNRSNAVTEGLNNFLSVACHLGYLIANILGSGHSLLLPNH